MQERPLRKIFSNNISMLILFVIVSYTTFYKSIFFTFIHDDWGFLERMHNTPFLDFIRQFVDAKRSLIRIILPVYDWIIYKAFGLNPVVPHIFALFLNSLNAFLVFMLSDYIMKDRFSAFAVGFMYASAVIHSESVSWALHPPDELCMVFFLLSFLFYIKERYVVSTIFFITSLFTKEAAVFLPIVLFFYNFYFTDEGKSLAGKIKTCFWRAKYHFAVLVIFLLVRFLISPNADLPDTHPYKIKLFGIHLIENALSYLKYILAEIIPASLYYGRNLLELSFIQELLLVVTVMAIFSALILLRKPSGINWKLILFCILFLGAGLGPVIFLPNHNYEYYLTLPSVSFLILIVYFIQKFLELIGLSSNRQKVLLVCYLVFHFILSSINYNYIYAEQSSPAQQNKMSYKLYKYMMKNYPVLSRGSIVVIKGINIFSINRSSALRIWYQDDSLEVYDFSDVVFEDGQYFIVNPILTQGDERVDFKRKLEKGKTVILDYRDHNYIDVTGDYL